MQIDPNKVSWDGPEVKPPPSQGAPPPQGAIDPSAVQWDGPENGVPTELPGKFTHDEERQFLAFIPKAKKPEDLDHFARTLTNGRVGIDNADEIYKDQQNTHRKHYGFTADPLANDKAPEPDVSAGEYLHGAVENVGRGFAHTLGFIDDTLNPVRMATDTWHDLKDTYHSLGHAFSGTELSPAELADRKARAEERMGPGTVERGIGQTYDNVAGVTPAKTALQRYINAGSQGVGGALVPMGGPARSLLKLPTLLAGVGGGVGAQAGEDLFPGNPLASLVGGIVGGHVAGVPLAIKPVRDNAALQITGENPQAALFPEPAQGLTDLASSKTQGGLVPHGRAKLTVPEINDVGEKYLHGLTGDLNKLVSGGKLDRERADTLRKAILNKDGITWEQLDALKGDTAGDAVAGAISHYKATRALTEPGGGRFTLGKLGTRAWNMTAGQIPWAGELLKFKPTDADAARIRAADKAIDRNPQFQQLPDTFTRERSTLTAREDHLGNRPKVGPSPVGPAMDKFRQSVSDTFAEQKAAAEAKAQAAERDRFASSIRKAQADADAKAQAAKKAAKSGMTDKEHRAYSERENAVQAEWTNPDFALAPRPKNVQASLDKVKGATQTAADWESALENGTTLNGKPVKAPTAAKAPKPNAKVALEKTISEQIDAGQKGSGNALNAAARILEVKPEDVSRVMGGLKLPEEFAFEGKKLFHGYNVDRSAMSQVILPRLRQALTEDGTIAARAKEAAAPKPAPAKTAAKASEKPQQISDKPPIEEPTSPPADDRELNWKGVRRPGAHAKGTARNKANFDRVVNDHAANHDGAMLSDAATGIEYMKETAPTTAEAMSYFDEILGPKLRRKGYEPEAIDHLRETLHEASTVGKKYRDQAHAEKEGMTRGPGRPRHTPTDDVPF
jgi:hypothetical protein